MLLPVILVLCVLPFVVYLAEYDTGFSQYNWNSDYSMIPDFYTCYRRSIFLVDAWILCWFTYTRAAIVALHWLWSRQIFKQGAGSEER